MVFISSLILSSTHFSQNFWCAPLARTVSANTKTATSLPPPSIQLIIQCLTEASASCFTKRHMKHFSKALKNHLPIRKRFFPLSPLPTDWYKRWIKRSMALQKSCYCKNETHNHIWILYSHSNTQWVSANGDEILPLTLSLHIFLLSDISKALQPVGRNRDIASLRLTYSGALLPRHLVTASFTGNCRHTRD